MTEFNDDYIRSPIIKELDITSLKELNIFTKGMKLKSKYMAKAVILDNKKYQDVADEYKVTQQAITEMVKRIYFKKYKRHYGKN